MITENEVSGLTTVFCMLIGSIPITSKRLVVFSNAQIFVSSPFTPFQFYTSFCGVGAVEVSGDWSSGLVGNQQVG